MNSGKEEPKDMDVEEEKASLVDSEDEEERHTRGKFTKMRLRHSLK